ncbi:hypothetical protein [Candidatus Palauibacter sp.]|uniref:PaaD-like zinc ribbon domain-containing protein n=1 Tax=Candidatus Palauibacter sp. TaxID=3101350 RepID=UPI003B02EA99
MPDDARRGDGKKRRALDRPVESASLPSSIPCPFCDADDSSPFTTFGGQASTAQYYCNACRTVFEAMRWR